MRRTLIDCAERAGATFAQSFLAVLTLGGILHVDLHALEVGAIAGGYSVAKYLMILANTYLQATPEATASPPTPQ